MNENFILHIKGDSCNIVVSTNPQLIMAVDPLDNSSERFLTFTIAEIKILVGMMTKLKELFPIEGHYYVHKACNILITICKQQLATEDVDELTEKYGI